MKWKGAVVGASAVVTTALAVVIAVANGYEPHSALFRHVRFDQAPSTAGRTVLVFGLVPGMLFGSMIASMAPSICRAPLWRRSLLMVGVALLALVVCLPFWPDLATYALPITILHALVLARWTSPRDPLPRAVIVRRTR